MIEKILPGAAACAEAFDDPPDAMLYPQEEAVISRAVEKRRREFRTVRHCARLALRDLGLPPAAVLTGKHREPLWPPGVVGSMTHCAGYRAAVVARSRDLLTVGIDAEPHQPLPPDVLAAISLADEQVQITELAALYGSSHWDRILFCAKETVYKAWFPLTQRWLGFQDAAITIDPVEGGFSARLLVPGPTITGQALTEFDGRWLISNSLVVTAIAVPRTRAALGCDHQRVADCDLHH
ncbi:MAG TPA: 4'-phosphopantetheinyl transferase superfamily protein [Pseudonocardiaceae bacterium]|nr:4'-phosphopantetheinyl transferase superfamily protein [Pseudonocardiaceae bacterium]